MKEHKAKLNQTLERGQTFLTKPSGRRTVMDPQLLRREYYNPNKFAVSFTLMESEADYVVRAGITTLPIFAVLEPDGFLVLNHGYYIVRSHNATEAMFGLVINFGDQIGKGNKLPSRPEVSVVQR